MDYLVDSRIVPDGSDLDSPRNSSVRAVASTGPSNDIHSPNTRSPSKMSAGSPGDLSGRQSKHFPTNKHLAQADPDYNRSSAPGVPAGNIGVVGGNNELINTELFKPTLRKKLPQSGTIASPTTPTVPSPHKSSRSQSNAQRRKLREPRKTSDSTSAPLAALVESAKKNVSILRKGQSGKETSVPQKRSYNEGYKERIESVENSQLFFRVPLEADAIISLLQTIYSNISSLEASLGPKLEKLKATTSASPFDEDLWNKFAWQQIQLVESYCDFLYHASSPSEKLAITKGLVRKYKIPTRLWNYGISSFVEVLRSRSPASNNVLARFVIHCMNLLMLFVDPIYDTRHIWIESLGDLALVCLMANVRACADWRDMCMYWYQRRSLLTPGTGRLYRHMATICESKIGSLFYICKSLTATQPMAIVPGDILSMLNRATFALGPSSADSEQSAYERTIVLNYVDMHLNCMGISTSGKFKIYHALGDDILNGHLIADHGASFAFCNIASLIGYGDESYSLWMFFKQTGKKRQPGSADPANEQWPVQFPKHDEYKRLQNNRELAFYILKAFLNSPDFSTGLQHVIIWMYFLIAVSQVPASIRDIYIDEAFPFALLSQFINHVNAIMDPENCEKSRRNPRLGPKRLAHVPEERLQHLMKITPESDRPQLEPIPSLQERPLPEEVHIRGFAWSQTLQYPQLNKDVTPLDEPYVAYYGEEYLTEVRTKRITALARDLEACSNWLYFDKSTELYTPRTQSG